MAGKKDFLKILGNNIRLYRNKKGFSQEELANLCGWNTSNARSIISKIESGTNDVTSSKLKLIAESLDVSVCDLMDSPRAQKQSVSIELTKQIYDEKIVSLVSAFLKLNTDDRIKILERINALFDDKNFFPKNK